MHYEISAMKASDWDQVSKIYLEGISTGIATFQTEIPSWADWDREHISTCRLVLRQGALVLGWGALSPTSNRCVYAGVAEVSIYIGESYRSRGLGQRLLNQLIIESEKNGYWTLQSGIVHANTASVTLHKKCGFRILGIREKVARMSNGKWSDVILMERRSKTAGID